MKFEDYSHPSFVSQHLSQQHAEHHRADDSKLVSRFCNESSHNAMQQGHLQLQPLN